MSHKVTINVIIDEELPEVKPYPWISSLLDLALSLTPYERLAPMEVSLFITTDHGIRPYNLSYRGKDKPTNVLAFPMMAKEEVDYPPLVGNLNLGDIVVSWSTLVKEASSLDISVEEHMAHLLVHGFLHLFHYDHDHPEDAYIMEDLERRILARAGWPDPYEAKE